MKKLFLFFVLLLLPITVFSKPLKVEVDRSYSVNLSTNDLLIILNQVSHIYFVQGINLEFIIDDTLLNVGTLHSENDMRNAFAKTRKYKNAIHMIIADEVGSDVFGITQFNSIIGWYPKQKDLDRTGSFIFIENIRRWSDIDSLTFNYSDTLVTFGELLTKVIAHELGHCLGLDHPEYGTNLRSLMNQGVRVSMINGPNNEGSRFSSDIKGINMNMILGIDRCLKWYTGEEIPIDFRYYQWKKARVNEEEKAQKEYEERK